jgi:signal transduction histidine kinase
VRWSAEALELTVADRGAGGPASEARTGGGHGLVGMRERVRLYGGELWTGRRAGGGFEVRARIPLVADTEMELV